MLLSDYDDRHFLKADGTYDLTTNVEVITLLTVERYHLHLNGEKTMFGENMVFLPFDYLCAKSLETGEILRSENTFTIHFILARISGSFMMISLHEEIKKENPEHALDGVIFRKDPVDIESETGKIIHRGLSPEAKVIETMDAALKILHS